MIKELVLDINIDNIMYGVIDINVDYKYAEDNPFQYRNEKSGNVRISRKFFDEQWITKIVLDGGYKPLEFSISSDELTWRMLLTGMTMIIFTK